LLTGRALREFRLRFAAFTLKCGTIGLQNAFNRFPIARRRAPDRWLRRLRDLKALGRLCQL
jgi:hypothetical protein